MDTHIAFYKHDGKIVFLNKDKKEVDSIDSSCILHYVSLSRMCGSCGKYTLLSLKDFVLSNKDIVKELLLK